MNSYLGLVKEYAKVHKKKNRLTVLCIAISVMLVTTVFSMADIGAEAQVRGYIQQNGNYHVTINGISDEVAEQIGGREEVKVSGWIGSAEGAVYQGKEMLVMGGGKEISAEMKLVAIEGEFPQTDNEALLDRKGLELLGLSIGNTADIPFNGGQTRQYRITGVYGDFSALSASDAHGLFLTIDGIRAVPSERYSEYYSIQFDKGVNIRRAIREIKAEYALTDEQVNENMRLLGLMGQSDDSAMWQLYYTIGALFALVALAGVFMIAGSFNMSVLERTQFFGLLRCLGASKKQIKRYIRLEGLLYSLHGIPIGLFAGCVSTWCCVLMLNIADLGDSVPKIALFQISFPGVAAGLAVGFLVVMFASGAPAKKAAGVSPQAAVTGNINRGVNRKIKRAANAKLHIDTAMGIHHAFSNKKNLILTAGSFALSIILFLGFTVLIDLMNHAVKPLKPYAPDISVTAADNSGTIDVSTADKLRGLPHIKQIYGRMIRSGIPDNDASAGETAVFVSYDKLQFHWAEEMLISGSIENAENGRGILVDHEKAQRAGWKPGDSVSLSIDGKAFEFVISGILDHVPFDAQDGEWIAICSESTFTGAIGISEYTIIDMQVNEDISAEIRSVILADMRLLDKQQSNREARAAYYTISVFIYGFLFVISLIALINIMNIVSASVSSRMNNYGVMRAVGMSGRQLKKIITAEAAAYAVTGCAVGSVLGLILHCLFYGLMITSNWGTAWRPPLAVLAVIVFSVLLTTFVSVLFPSKQIEKMSIANVLNAG
jgi:putative ABC transport system permease protein